MEWRGTDSMRPALRIDGLSLKWLAILLAAAGPTASASGQDGWREWDAGDVTFLSPPRLRAPGVDRQTPAQVDRNGPDWNFTITDNPNRPDRGATLTFVWSRDVTEEPTGDEVMSDARMRLGGRDARKITWRTPSMGWRGYDVIIDGGAKDGTRFRFTCHAPEFRWRETRSLCDRVAETIRFPNETAQVAKPSDEASPQQQLEIARERLALFLKNQAVAEWQGAYEAAKKAVAMEPRSSENWRIYGYANSLAPADREKYASQAESAYRRSIELDARNTQARFLLASLLISRDSLAPAIEQIETALDVKPELATRKVVEDLTHLYQKTGERDRGVSFYSGFVVRHPEARAAALGQAILLKDTGKRAEALLALQKLATDPSAAPDETAQARALLNSWL